MDLLISEKFRELKSRLLQYRYQVSTNALFEPLCWLHDYLLQSKDTEAKNEYVEILHDILIEIFMPLRQPEYQRYPEGLRSYFGSNIVLQQTIRYIFDLNVYSKIWLKDLSEYYTVFSDTFPHYNQVQKVDFSQSQEKVFIHGVKNSGAIRSKILDHLRIHVDPDKPLPPTTDNPVDHYIYRFENALYEESKVKNRFFQNMKYKEFRELQQEHTAILNLTCRSRQEEEVFDEEEETISWVVKLVPQTHDPLYLYPLFKDNPCVYIYAYQKELDLFNPARSNFKGKIIQVDEENGFILVRVQGQKFTEKPNFALVLRPDYVTFSREKEALTQFKFHPNQELVNLIVSKFYSEQESQLEIKEFFGNDLNETQRKAVEKAINAKHLFCIHGPPGTGKTRVCAEILAQSLLLNPKVRVLVSSASDEATDNLMNAFKKVLPSSLHSLILRLGADGASSLNQRVKTSPEYTEKIANLLQELSSCSTQTNELREKRKEKEQEMHQLLHQEASLNEHLTDGTSLDLLDQLRKDKDALIRELIKLRFAVDEGDKKEKELKERLSYNREELKRGFLSTLPLFVFCTNNHSGVLPKFKLEFDLLVVDEVTQSTEPSVLIPLNQTKKIIMAGDHHQLPPTVFLKNKNYDEEVDPVAEKIRIQSYQILSKSIFERLYGTINSLYLDRQYRMHPLLVEFLNQTIYAQTPLVCDALVDNYRFNDSLFDRSLVFISHSGEEVKSYVSEEFSPSKAEYHNPEEVCLVEKLVKKYLHSGISPFDIGVLSPYKAQIRELNKVLEPLKVVAKTIDNFQGQEKKIIFLSLVRSNSGGEATQRLGFLVDERRFNVAITRFQYELIVIGNEETLSSYESYHDLYDDQVKPIYYKKLIEHIKAKGKYISNLEPYLQKKVSFQLPNVSEMSSSINKALQQKLLKRKI
ncbi:MAG: AAA domain-containing protein [Candidatus Woesearchaeota archaeon]